MEISELNKLIEGFLPTHEVVGTIIEDKHGFNILDPEGVKMLNHSYPSLKMMLQDIVANL